MKCSGEQKNIEKANGSSDAGGAVLLVLDGQLKLVMELENWKKAEVEAAVLGSFVLFLSLSLSFSIQ